MGVGDGNLVEDRGLAARAGAGDASAFEALAVRHRDALVRGAAGWLGESRQAAEDVVQDALIKAYRALESGSQPQNPRAWLFAIVHNCCIDHLRATRPTTILSEDLPSGSDTHARAEERESVASLVQAIGELPGRQRDMLVARELGGDSHAELAARHGTTIPSVKSVLLRARRSLIERRPLQVLVPFAAAVTRRVSAFTDGDGDGAVFRAGGGALAVAAKIAMTTALTSSVMLAVPNARPGSASATDPPSTIPRAHVVATSGKAAPAPISRPSGQTARTRHVRPVRTLSPAQQAIAVHRVIHQCGADETVDGRYATATLIQARDQLPADIEQYTECGRVLQKAILSAASRGQAKRDHPSSPPSH